MQIKNPILSVSIISQHVSRLVFINKSLGHPCAHSSTHMLFVPAFPFLPIEEEEAVTHKKIKNPWGFWERAWRGNEGLDHVSLALICKHLHRAKKSTTISHLQAEQTATGQWESRWSGRRFSGQMFDQVGQKERREKKEKDVWWWFPGENKCKETSASPQF